jgi:hypothetical protein
MTKRNDEYKFDIILDDGRVARCWQAVSQPYQNCIFSAGLVEGIPPDTLYFMVKRDDQAEPYMLFLRPDEMQAITWVCNGALWSQQMINLDNGKCPQARYKKNRAKNKNTLTSPPVL